MNCWLQAQQDIFNVPDTGKQNLGYSIGAGAYRLSPHAIGSPERFGPLAANPSGKDTLYQPDLRAGHPLPED